MKRNKNIKHRQNEIREAERKRKERLEEKNAKKLKPDLFHLNLYFTRNYPSHFTFKLIDYLFLTLVTFISFVTHLIKNGSPSSVVFDEVYFGNFTQYYHKGIYYFDIHPPLGKELLYLGSLISGYQPNQTYSYIGAPLDKSQIARLRLWPCLTGSLIAPVIYLTLRILDVNPQWSLTVGLFLSTDNALIVETRLVLIDAYLSFFASLTLLFCSIITRKPKHIKYISILAGIFAGSCVSIKFTGCGIAVTLVVVYLMTYPLIEAMLYSFISAISGFSIFFLSFIIHFMMLPHPGPGCRYHTPDFCQKLSKHKHDNYIVSTINLISIMLRSNFAISATHSYSSKWWQWPFMLGKGTYLWVEDMSQLWCVGSPVVWLSGVVGIIAFLCFLCLRWDLSRKLLWLLFGYLISYLPFACIKRVMYNYHYFIPLIVSLIMGAVALSHFFPNAFVTPALLCLAALVAYMVWFPITYGTPISNKLFSKIMFHKWIYE
ncbi:dolichyl-phosphate-mannose-protein mannosyltransferase [Histomonas meleagridis]|uniref:dolichyl-phosphate-mannose-protein mannosyltransferase n=1 Tax=Histomonas meleagridis TaxID=135588 RepID=UPI003559E3CA|nr:dolichyl-phosphate-mannose-protein mannosyltransferase [Histomonas meleagridis]KAH0802213.1 dolichyl-phosphate-mannose-protein mannosyltransferase [Histomonas meleagridis]